MILFKFLLFISISLFSFFTFSEEKASPTTPPSAQSLNIRSGHWFGSLPPPQKSQETLLIHNIFIILFDTEKKFPSWVAYQLSPALLWGQLKAERKYKADPLLKPGQSLIFKDYKGASRCEGTDKGYDKGHLAPLGSFKASAYAYQAQYLSNIVPQSRNLNQGPWRLLEEKIRSFVKKGNEVKILTGTVYGQEGKDKLPPCWKAAQGKLEEIPVAYWKVVSSLQKSKIQVCAFLMPQKVNNRRVHFKKFQISVKNLEKKMGFPLLTNTKHTITENCKFLF